MAELKITESQKSLLKRLLSKEQEKVIKEWEHRNESFIRAFNEECTQEFIDSLFKFVQSSENRAIEIADLMDQLTD